MTDYFHKDLQRAEAFHGHLCSGIILGVRIARAGLTYLGIEEPSQNRDFIVYVEADRCLTDAVQSVTGCSLGKRRLKWIDYGKMGASFIDMNTQEGIRIVVNSKNNPEDGVDLVAFWSQFSDEELFKFQPVRVPLKKEDMPGKPMRSAICEQCNEKIMDGRDLIVEGKVLCEACAKGAYYQVI